MDGGIVQCAVTDSIFVGASNTLEAGGRTELYAPTVVFGENFSPPLGAELKVDSSNVVPPP